MPDYIKTRNEITRLERHDWHLWWTAVLVILALTVTIVGFYAPHFVSQSRKDPVLQLKTYLYGLSLLILLFCIYVLRVGYNLGTLRKQLLQKEMEKTGKQTGKYQEKRNKTVTVEKRCGCRTGPSCEL